MMISKAPVQTPSPGAQVATAQAAGHPQNGSKVQRGMAGLLVATTLIVSTACGRDVAYEEKPPRLVRTLQVERLPEVADYRFSGVVQAGQRSRLSFQVPGRLARRAVDLGDRVVRGQVVAELETTDFRLRLERASSSAQAARAGAREARSAFARIQALYVDDNATRDQLDRALSAQERADAAEAEAERGLELARRELAYTRLLAPAEGRVAALLAEADENLSAGQGVIEWQAEDRALEVGWTVPEGLVASLERGQSVEVTFPAIGGSAVATVVEVAASPGNSAYPITARLDNDLPRLRPGMAAEVWLRLPRGARAEGAAGPADTDSGGVVVLPTPAVAGDPQGWYVFVVRADNGSALADGQDGTVGGPVTVQRRPVTVGALRPEGLEVISGLEGGETVVSAGTGFLVDGQTVRLLTADPLAELPSVSPSAPVGMSPAGVAPASTAPSAGLGNVGGAL